MHACVPSTVKVLAMMDGATSCIASQFSLPFVSKVSVLVILGVKNMIRLCKCEVL